MIWNVFKNYRKSTKIISFFWRNQNWLAKIYDCRPQHTAGHTALQNGPSSVELNTATGNTSFQHSPSTTDLDTAGRTLHNGPHLQGWFLHQGQFSPFGSGLFRICDSSIAGQTSPSTVGLTFKTASSIKVQFSPS